MIQNIRYLLKLTTPSTGMWRVEITSAHYNNTGIYKIICQVCCRLYMGQSGRNFKGHFPKPVTYIEPSTSQSVYPTYLLYVSHSYRPPASTTKLTEHSKYRWKMNADENLHTDLHTKGQSCNQLTSWWEHNTVAEITNKLQTSDASALARSLHQSTPSIC